jgi:hypothetical protein
MHFNERPNLSANSESQPYPDKDKNSVKSTLVYLLKEEVEDTFGRMIATSRDCLQLSEEIYFKTSYRINANTLRRFFGLVKAEYPASTSTLTILSKYCGFNTLDEVHYIRKHNGEPLPEGSSLLDFIIALYRDTQIRDVNDETFLALVKQTIQLLNKQPELAEKFQRAIAKTRNGQDFYFEQFVNIDKLNSYFGDGLRFYLSEKQDPEAQIFGYSLLCLRDWLTEDHQSMRKHFEEIKRLKPSRNTHPFVSGRYYAAHLYFADMQGLNTDKILFEAYNLHTGIAPAKDNYCLFPCFEYMFSSALMLTMHYHEALHYTEYALKNYTERHHYMDKGFYKSLELIRAIAFCKCGQKKEAEDLYNRLRPSQFYFLTKKVNTILYLLLGNWLGKRNPKWEEQMEDLAKETGFTRLKKLF